MEPVIHKGKLVKWNDDRGFGFIQSAGDDRNIFLHISALKGQLPKGTPRRPKEGDVILYQRVVRSDGKIRAENASIQGITPQHHSNNPNTNNLNTNKRKLQGKARSRQYSMSSRSHHSGNIKQHSSHLLFRLVILVIGISFVALSNSGHFSSDIQSIMKPGCNIKGNISVSSGKKLYHLPGMKDYENTIITRSKGEKWFCSEAEAIESGWVKAPR